MSIEQPPDAQRMEFDHTAIVIHSWIEGGKRRFHWYKPYSQDEGNGMFFANNKPVARLSTKGGKLIAGETVKREKP